MPILQKGKLRPEEPSSLEWRQATPLTPPLFHQEVDPQLGKLWRLRIVSPMEAQSHISCPLLCHKPHWLPRCMHGLTR